MSSKKRNEPNGLVVRVLRSQELVAQAVCRRAVSGRKFASGAEANVDECWVTESVLIDHNLRPWQISFMKQYLPKKGEVVEWFFTETETTATRLQNVYEGHIGRFRNEVTVAEAEQDWRVTLERCDLVSDIPASVNVCGRVELDQRDGDD